MHDYDQVRFLRERDFDASKPGVQSEVLFSLVLGKEQDGRKGRQLQRWKHDPSTHVQTVWT